MRLTRVRGSELRTVALENKQTNYLSDESLEDALCMIREYINKAQLDLDTTKSNGDEIFFVRGGFKISFKDLKGFKDFLINEV